MKKFLFTANCTFLARDLDDVFRQLAQHFLGITKGEDDNSWLVGEMKIEPIKEVVTMPCKGGKKKGGKKGGK